MGRPKVKIKVNVREVENREMIYIVKSKKFVKWPSHCPILESLKSLKVLKRCKRCNIMNDVQHVIGIYIFDACA